MSNERCEKGSIEAVPYWNWFIDVPSREGDHGFFQSSILKYSESACGNPNDSISIFGPSFQTRVTSVASTRELQRELYAPSKASGKEGERTCYT